MDSLPEIESLETPEEKGPQRTCIASGVVQAKEGMIRFVMSPQDFVVPDLAERLPGRGVWVGADRDLLEAAIKTRRFVRSFRKPLHTPPDLIERVESGLRRRVLDGLALVNKSGLAVVGFAKVEPLAAAGKTALLFEAVDGASESEKLIGIVNRRGGEVCRIFTRQELGAPFGRDELVHIACKSGGTTTRLQREVRRLAGFSKNVPI